MAEGDKPYRRYRGGRVKGRVPLERRNSDAAAQPAGGDEKPRGRRRWGRWIVLAVVGLLLLTVVWGVLGYLSFSSGVDEANERLPRRAEGRLADLDGSLFSKPATILVIGTDGGKAPGRGDARRADSLLLLRTDPGKHRLSYLSIPRDLRVDIPGYGSGKINAANQIGGPALTLATVRALTGLPIHHVVVFDFDGFRELIDALGGVDIDVPKKILSNKFDCPYKPARCDTWEGWRFEKGTQHMDGRRALVYARIRSNQNDSSDNDLTRGSRQQAVADAVGDKIASLGTFAPPPLHRRLSGRAARDRPLGLGDRAARLGSLPRGLRPLAPLPARRHAVVRRERVGHPRLRGQRRGHLDVPAALGRASAGEGRSLRRRLHAALATPHQSLAGGVLFFSAAGALSAGFSFALSAGAESPSFGLRPPRP